LVLNVQVATSCEAAAQALAAACFINPTGLFGSGRKTVTKVAVAVGRPGISCFPERVPANQVD